MANLKKKKKERGKEDSKPIKREFIFTNAGCSEANYTQRESRRK